MQFSDALKTSAKESKRISLMHQNSKIVSQWLKITKNVSFEFSRQINIFFFFKFSNVSAAADFWHEKFSFILKKREF